MTASTFGVRFRASKASTNALHGLIALNGSRGQQQLYQWVAARTIVRMSCQTAPLGEVTTPMRLGNSGIGRFLEGSNRPSVSSFSFSCSSRS